ncbi:RNA-binding domain-containing protein [Mycena amicta]|nr:RNA-binding domain-containing protein [Mycena amicta]
MADYAYAFKAPPTHPYYQHPATQWDTPRPFSTPTQAQSLLPYPHAHTSSSSQSLASAPPQQPAQPEQHPASLLWTSLEPWMDQEYARQVCSLLGWDARVRVPPLDGVVAGGTTANNAGYAVLTFTSSAAATAALTQINSGASTIPSITGHSSSTTSTTSNPSSTSTMTMPNSSRSFVMGWAPAGLAVAPTASPPSSSPPSTTSSYASLVSPTSLLSPVSAGSGHSNGHRSGYTHAMSVHSAPTHPYPKEYSIFVGDLAPETSNSDLVAVFRNPVLGLRNDRAPKFIRPFTSCTSAKIMLDPVTGVSRGYGFVRFTDEADQQRALIEMHGLYCLSRPMRISPATAKVTPPTTTEGGLAGSSSLGNIGAARETVPLPPSVSAPIATASYYPQAPSQPPNDYYAQPSAAIPPASHPLPHQRALPPSVQQPPASALSVPDPSSSSSTAAEWKHHAHARAILGNLIGPNGEQLTSTDPYNTTVFVGGLSPLVGEETLRTFFVPFGEIHYVKVPVGKHCGFVQFVRKADAEQAIERMQGFPVGGSRIRLSWGRSQYKAAQAAAQAAQAAALQVPPSLPPSLQPQVPVQSATGITPQMLAEMTQEQIVVLLQKFGPQALFGGNGAGASPATTTTTGYTPNRTTTDPYRGFNASPSSTTPTTHAPQYTEEGIKVAVRRDDGPFGHGFAQRPASASSSSFSPFSPDPNAHHAQQQQPQPSGLYPHLPAQDMLAMRRDSYSGVLPLPPTNTSKSYAPGWITGASAGGSSSPTRGYASGVGVGFSSGTTSPPSFQVNHYQVPPDSSSSRQPISRPTSGVSVRGEDTREWMDDLNGTLASLDLGLGWGRLKTRSAPASEENASASSGGSGSVQFRMTSSP